MLIDAAAARDYVAVFFIVLVVNFLPAHSSPTSYITEYYSNDSYKQEVLCQYKFMRLENASKYLARWGAMGQINTIGPAINYSNKFIRSSAVQSKKKKRQGGEGGRRSRSFSVRIL
jgi:hypothetical protein